MMGRPRKQRRQQHGSAWRWKQTDCWYCTLPGTKKRMPLLDENGQRIRGKENQEAAEAALARVKVVNAAGAEGPLERRDWLVAKVCSEYTQLFSFFCTTLDAKRDCLMNVTIRIPVVAALIALLITSSAALRAAAPAVSEKPNIVLIFADDLGWKDVGYQGSDFIETPNIDQLAEQGMVFTNGYAAAGNCAPSRACLLSGTYTPRHEVYAVGSTDRGPAAEQRLVPIPNKSGLAQDNITVADALKAAGYVTGIFGKWHLDGKDGAQPAEQGFDFVYQSAHGSSGNDAANPKQIYSLTQGVCEFMEKNKSRPFFVYLSHYAIHGPLQARPSTLERFRAKPPGAQHRDPLYAACTYDLDDGVGVLLKKLADLGLEENTLVVFTSDNGGTQNSSQEPLRGNKGCYYEGGIREPFIARWPAAIKPGSRCDVPVINVDLYPTFLAAAGASAPVGKTLDGESLLPLFKGIGGLKRSAIFWHFPGYLNKPVIRGRELDIRTGFRTRPVSVIRKGDWKLHLFHEEWQLDGGRPKLSENHAVELYNLKDDIGERNDLANTNIAKRDELLDDLLAWQKSIGARTPSRRNPNYDSAAPGKGRK
jgi:arylsulfatase A-like enzyme